MTEQVGLAAPATATAPGHVLDRAVQASLAERHAPFALRFGRAVRYDPEVSPFAALDDPADPQAWEDAATLLGPEGKLSLQCVSEWPADWKPVFGLDGVQMVGTGLDPRPEPEAVRLGQADVPDMLELVARTEPGPFLPRTVEMGTYLGIRREGVLVAMAGERLHPPGWTEISAVCTLPEYRGQGIAGRLIRALAAGITARGETPFLHAAASNTNAIRLYRTLGFEHRRTVLFSLLEHA